MTLDGFSSAVAMRQALSAGTISPGELLELHARRFERFNPTLNAIVIGDLDHAKEAALSADVTTPLGGPPITIKDVMDVKGLPSTGGGVLTLDHVAQADARSVAKLHGAGAVIMDKTDTPSFAADWQTTNALFGTTPTRGISRARRAFTLGSGIGYRRLDPHSRGLLRHLWPQAERGDRASQWRFCVALHQRGDRSFGMGTAGA